MEGEVEPEVDEIQSRAQLHDTDDDNDRGSGHIGASQNKPPLPPCGGYIRPPGRPVSNNRSAPESGHHEELVQVTPRTMSTVQQVQSQRDGSVRSTIRQGLPMSTVYSTAILAILGEDPKIKRGAVRQLLISRLNLDLNNLPDNFPTAEQVASKVSNFRRSAAKNTRPSKRARTE